MLYLFYGSDREKINRKTTELISALLSKKPDASSLKIDSENVVETNVTDLVEGQGLFERKYIVLLDRILLIDEGKDFLSKIKEMVESENIFIAREEKILSKDLTKLEKYANKVQKFDLALGSDASVYGEIGGVNRANRSAEKFNVFEIANKFSMCDGIGAWITYRQALESGIEPENISGILFWQMKALILAGESKSAGESGLNPFVFSKAKTASAKWKKEELEKSATDLIRIYHESRNDSLKLDLALERFLLSFAK